MLITINTLTGCSCLVLLVIAHWHLYNKLANNHGPMKFDCMGSFKRPELNTPPQNNWSGGRNVLGLEEFK